MMGRCTFIVIISGSHKPSCLESLGWGLGFEVQGLRFRASGFGVLGYQALGLCGVLRFRI